MPDTPEKIPANLIAGDSWSWLRELSDYPAPTWDAVWYFEKADAQFSVASTDSGTAHLATVSAATTAPYSAGKYRWSLRVTDGTNAYVVERGDVVVEPNPAAAGTYDTRSTAEKVVASLEALAQRRALSGQTSVSIDGVSMTFDTMADVIVALNFWRNEVKREQVAAGILPGGRRTIRVRFGRP